jgi:hypothetical protein
MARATITPVKLSGYNEFSETVVTADALKAVDATDGAEFVMEKSDEKYVLRIANAHASQAKTVTIVAGNGIQGVVDATQLITAGNEVYITIDSGRFKNVYGADKGKVIIKGDTADIKVAVIIQP